MCCKEGRITGRPLLGNVARQMTASDNPKNVSFFFSFSKGQTKHAHRCTHHICLFVSFSLFFLDRPVWEPNRGGWNLSEDPNKLRQNSPLDVGHTLLNRRRIRSNFGGIFHIPCPHIFNNISNLFLFFLMGGTEIHRIFNCTREGGGQNVR